MPLTVTEGDSVFDATSPGGLEISKNEPLLWWKDKYDEYHGTSAPVPMKSEIEWTQDSVIIDNVKISCHRTLRVPEGDEISELPPVRGPGFYYKRRAFLMVSQDIGPCPLFPVTRLGVRAPEGIKKRGGFIMVMI